MAHSKIRSARPPLPTARSPQNCPGSFDEKAASRSDSARLDRIIRAAELPKYAGLQRTVIAELIAAGEFPPPVRLTDRGRAVGWLESDLVAWQQERRRKRDGGGA